MTHAPLPEDQQGILYGSGGNQQVQRTTDPQGRVVVEHQPRGGVGEHDARLVVADEKPFLEGREDRFEADLTALRVARAGRCGLSERAFRPREPGAEAADRLRDVAEEVVPRQFDGVLWVEADDPGLPAEHLQRLEHEPPECADEHADDQDGQAGGDAEGLVGPSPGHGVVRSRQEQQVRAREERPAQEHCSAQEAPGVQPSSFHGTLLPGPRFQAPDFEASISLTFRTTSLVEKGLVM